jgi:hypothetical protein
LFFSPPFTNGTDVHLHHHQIWNQTTSTKAVRFSFHPSSQTKNTAQPQAGNMPHSSVPRNKQERKESKQKNEGKTPPRPTLIAA